MMKKAHGKIDYQHSYEITMENLLNTVAVQTLQQGRHVQYIVEWNVIKPIVKKWSRNREPDFTRVTELKHYVDNGGYFPPILHLADLEDEGLVCYDGNHRRELLNILEKPQKIFIDVLMRATQNDVYEAFEAINKSVQVPAIYLDNVTKPNVKEELLSIVRGYELKYKNHTSPSPRCHAPQFNRDNFLDNLYNIYTKNEGRFTVTDLKKILEYLNIMYSLQRICKPHNQFKPKIIEKCKDSGLWLFIDKEIPNDHVVTAFMMLSK